MAGCTQRTSFRAVLDLARSCGGSRASCAHSTAIAKRAGLLFVFADSRSHSSDEASATSEADGRAYTSAFNGGGRPKGLTDGILNREVQLEDKNRSGRSTFDSSAMRVAECRVGCSRGKVVGQASMNSSNSTQATSHNHNVQTSSFGASRSSQGQSTGKRICLVLAV